jgi:hypothetical protein
MSLSFPTSAIGAQQQLANFQRLITDRFQSGQLSQSDADQLEDQLGQLQQSLSTDGFDPIAFQSQAAAFRCDLRDKVQNASFNLDKRTSWLEQRIAAGTKNGALTQDEAQGLSAQLDGIKQALASMRSSGPLTPDQRSQINGELNQLQHSLCSDDHNASMNPSARLANFAQRISRGLADGSLTQAGADRLNSELVSLQSQLAQGDVNPSAINALDRDIFRCRHNATVAMGPRLSAVQNAINNAVCSGQITTAQGEALLGQLSQCSDSGARVNMIGEQLRAMIAGVPDADPSLSSSIFAQRSMIRC